MIRTFFNFTGALVSTTFSASPELVNDYRARKEFLKSITLQMNLCYGEYGDLDFPIVYRQCKDSYGKKKMRDVLNPGFIHLPLISDRLKDLLEESEITGWRCYPIELYDKKGNKVCGYNGFSIIGRAGTVVELENPPYELGYSPNSYGYSFDLNTWDGSDIFRGLPNHIIVTEKLADILLKNKISGICLTRLTDCGDYKKSKRIL